MNAARAPTDADLQALLAPQTPPCVSIYLPTHRGYPQTQQDPIRFRNALRAAEESLRRGFPKSDAAALLARLARYADDADFWIYAGDGVAMFAAPEHFAVFKLERDVPERTIVAPSFHTKPLLRILQSADRYQVLAISRAEARFYQGNRDTLERVPLVNVPTTVEEALGEELTEPFLKAGSYGGLGGSGAAAFHGHGSKKDEVDLDRDRFFRAVDRALTQHYSRPSGLPLLLAALPEHQTHFRRISHNPLLIDAGIETNPHGMSVEDLRASAWQRIEPRYFERLARLKDAFCEAKAHGLGSDEPERVALATVEGRVGTLLLEAERSLPGRIDESGRIQPGDLADPDIDDVLDDLAEAVLRRKGEVVVVPRERMPSETGLAATYRF
jgi:hypothetical protein